MDFKSQIIELVRGEAKYADNLLMMKVDDCSAARADVFEQVVANERVFKVDGHDIKIQWLGENGAFYTHTPYNGRVVAKYTHLMMAEIERTVRKIHSGDWNLVYLPTHPPIK